MRFLIRALPAKLARWPGLFILTLGGSTLCTTALAAQAAQADPIAGSDAVQAKDGVPGGTTGGEFCAKCHEEIAKAFANNPHARTSPGDGGAPLYCGQCHGAGVEHAKAGDITKVFNPAGGSAKVVDSICMGCHQGEHQKAGRSSHAAGTLSCVACHSVHGSKAGHLLRIAQPALCYHCHADTTAQFSLPFRHKVNQGLIQCTDCHDPHSTFEREGPRLVGEQSEACAKCHADTAGPFIHEHPVVKIEGCTACHLPHGGPNPKMLNRSNVDTICQQCHFIGASSSISASADLAHGRRTAGESCVSCHIGIHGSNVSAVFLRPFD